MAARSGMTDLIDRVRGMTDTTRSDYTIDDVTYWSNEHIQTALDQFRTDIYHEELIIIDKWAGGGTIEYYEYQSRFRNFEKTTGGTTIFYIEDGTGADVGTASYSVDYNRGRITFGSDTSGSVYYLTGRSYDLNAAAADIWRRKAANAAKVYDIRSDNQGLSRSQIMKQCFQMAEYYDSIAEPETIEMFRDDLNA